MEYLGITLFITASCALWLGAAKLDAERNWRLLDWFNGECSNPFTGSGSTQAMHTEDNKDELIKQLKERIEVLEKVVTEPAYELNKKINQL